MQGRKLVKFCVKKRGATEHLEGFLRCSSQNREMGCPLACPSGAQSVPIRISTFLEFDLAILDFTVHSVALGSLPRLTGWTDRSLNDLLILLYVHPPSFVDSFPNSFVDSFPKLQDKKSGSHGSDPGASWPTDMPRFASFYQRFIRVFDGPSGTVEKC